MKKLSKLLLSLLMVFGMVTTLPSLTATEVYAETVNSTMDSATTVSYGTTIEDEVSEDNPSRYYQFTVSSNGAVKVIHTNVEGTRVSYKIYDANGNEVWNEGSFTDSTSVTANLLKGTYYMEVYAEKYCMVYTYGTYKFKLTFTSANETYTGDNGTIDNAYSVSYDTTYIGQVADNRSSDWYKFTVASNGAVKVIHTNVSGTRVSYKIYDENGNEVWNEGSFTDSTSVTANLLKGTYYLEVYVATYNFNYTYGPYKFKLSFTTANETYTGDNSTVDNAYGISTGTTYTGQVADNRSSDWYKFDILTDGILTVNHINVNGTRVSYTVYDANENEISSEGSYTDSNSFTVNVSKGTYYLEVHAEKYCMEYTYGPYQFKTSFVFTSSVPTLTVSTNGTSKLNLSWSKISGATGYEIYRSTSSSGSYSKIATTTSTSYTNTGLTSGKTYYYKVRAYKTVSGTNVYSNYSSVTSKKVLTAMSATTISLSSTSMTYTGSALKPTVTVKNGSKTLTKGTDYTVTYASDRKNVGTYKVTIKGKGNYTGTITKTFKIKPATTSIKSLTKAKKAFTVKWTKKTTQVTGYQIQYSTSSKFSSAKTVTISKNSTTSKKISSLKAKTKYYVRIRAYKTVNGTKYYSSWSSSKTVTTK